MGLDIYFNKVKKNVDQLGYFRKVNFLVGFFERNGEPVENLADFVIDKTDAEELLDYCNQVLEDHDKASKLLPTTPGFFFGRYEYDDDYFEDVKEVRNFCEKVLVPEFDNLDDDEEIIFQIWY